MAVASHSGPGSVRGRSTFVLEGSIPSAFAVPPGCSFHTRCPLARLIARESAPGAVETADGPVPRRCAEAEPIPDPAPDGASAAACHFAGERPFDHPSPSST
jgi:oligopeptide transport system ATP-binding protein